MNRSLDKADGQELSIYDFYKRYQTLVVTGKLYTNLCVQEHRHSLGHMLRNF